MAYQINLNKQLHVQANQQQCVYTQNILIRYTNMKQQIQQPAQTGSSVVSQPQIVTLYKQLHMMPQIGLQQYKTTQFIKQYLKQIEGVELIAPSVETQLKTGVVAFLRSTNPNLDRNKLNNNAYLFRCDIDALNFKQESGVPYASQNGLHHACGHDAHTSIMLIAVKKLAKQRQHLLRDIYFCFQSGEEGHGGASKLLQKYPTLLERVQYCFALHVGNHKQKQMLLIPSQYVTANSNRFTIEVIGKSAHCMIPSAAIDANYIGCQIVNQIYTLKTRLIDPMGGMTVAVTKIEGGNDNVTSISGYMKISGSIRSFITKDHQKVIEYIEKFTKSICQLNGAQYKFTVNKNLYRAVKNQPSAIHIVEKSAKKLYEQIQFCKAGFAGEDFCQFSERKPSCYFILAVGLPDSIDKTTGQSKFPIHSNKFKLDETALEKASDLWVRIALS